MVEGGQGAPRPGLGGRHGGQQQTAQAKMLAPLLREVQALVGKLGVEYCALQPTRTQHNPALQVRLRAYQGLRFTLKALDSATEEASASFARIGAECKTSQAPRCKILLP
ncbi:hypothetical protein PR001_g27252 [Phytophthora rubi]|uniref:Uncharacterized protein n=1 Tax=Phytophthora rubi TaxID=129364 RepID=A0A6A3HMV1_9STRA|nr:hypothetical protein PR001_g27252 [Phytophthora rubi]